MEHMHHSTIVLGPCHTSVYLESLEHCTLYITCHQLRIHNCKHCILYVKVQSHPIIEDCEEMFFAPYNVQYPTVEEELKICNLTHANCWNNVVDFRWHKTTPSPNWKVLEEGARQLPPLMMIGNTEEKKKQIEVAVDVKVVAEDEDDEF